MYGAILGDMLGGSYSTMDGIMPVWEVIKKAADLGCSAVAITDHGTVQGFPDAQWASRQYGIKVICGMEGYYRNDVDGDHSVTHITLLVRNKTGLENLCAIFICSDIRSSYG